MTFWEWVRAYANKRVRRAHMDRAHHERRCPNCRVWTSEVGGCAALVDDPSDPWSELMMCSQCGFVSRWDCRGMLPVIAAVHPADARPLRHDEVMEAER